MRELCQRWKQNKKRNVHLLFDEPLVLGFAFLDKIILLEQLLE